LSPYSYLINRPHPIPTLFPYTTLFRSPETCSAVLIDPELSQVDRYLALAARAGLRFHYIVDTHTHADHFSAARELSRRLEVPSVDRKSTRLNSSHEWISYAVFCLKKKN